jgi:hypothetical protein
MRIARERVEEHLHIRSDSAAVPPREGGDSDAEGSAGETYG